MSSEFDETTFATSDPGDKYRNSKLFGDRLMIRIGDAAAWIFIILLVAIVTQVFIRKAGYNQAWLDDMQWWMYGFAMLVGFGYAITTDSHVRVDILHQNYSTEKKARIEVFALGWLLLPFLVMMTDILTHYAYSSWRTGEGSDSPNGLHMLYLLKISLPILFVAATFAAWAVLKRNLEKLTTPYYWKMLLAALPAAWFVVERAVYYSLWWFIRLTQPDLNPRRISKEVLVEHTFWMGLALLLIITGIAFARARNASKG